MGLFCCFGGEEKPVTVQKKKETVVEEQPPPPPPVLQKIPSVTIPAPPPQPVEHSEPVSVNGNLAAVAPIDPPKDSGSDEDILKLPIPSPRSQTSSQPPLDGDIDAESLVAQLHPLNNGLPNAPIAAQTFSFKELERATKGFSQNNFIGEGGFGRVYKGKLESTGQIVAVKQLDRNGLQGNREFLVEVLMLSLLHHPNLVNLIGYCADGDQRVLVYEFMHHGCLEDHLHDLPENKEPLDWNTRMKVAAGAARGLEYLHDKANPPVIYRDFKSSNILLDENWHPKLSDFGLAKLGPVGDKTHVSTRVMGTYGYCAPEYAMTGQLTLKSDVYSFGVVLLELITGRKAIDNSRGQGEHNLVAWARPLFKDRRKFPSMSDPLLRGRYPMRGLYQALAVAAMCLQEQASVRPLIGDVVTALSYLAAQNYDPNSQPSSRFAPGTPSHEREMRRSSRSPGMGRLRGSPLGTSPRNSPDMRPRGPRNSPDLRPGRGKDNDERAGSMSPTTSRGYRESPVKGRLPPGTTQKGGGGEPGSRGWGENWRER